jgi:hypothetical protein
MPFNCDDGEFSDKVNNENVSKVLKMGMRRIDRTKKKFVEDVLKYPLKTPNDKGIKRKEDGKDMYLTEACD